MMMMNKVRVRRSKIRLIDVWNNVVLHNAAILVPILSILLAATMIISHLPMHQEPCEVNHIEIGNSGFETAREAPCPCHNPVAEIVDMPRFPPPPINDQLSAPFCRHGLQISHRGVVGVVAESVLLT